MSEDEVGVASHEVEFVIIWGGDEDKRGEVGFGVIHFAFGKLFVPGDLVRFFESGEKIDEHQVGIFTGFEGILPSIENKQFVVRLKSTFGTFDEVGIFGDEDELHVMTIEDGRG